MVKCNRKVNYVDNNGRIGWCFLLFFKHKASTILDKIGGGKNGLDAIVERN